MSERELLHTDRVLVVEGKYDAARLSHLTDAMILLTDGFGIYKDKKRQQLLKALAKKNGLILFTDSDAAGFRIRTYITGLVGAENVETERNRTCTSGFNQSSAVDRRRYRIRSDSERLYNQTQQEREESSSEVCTDQQSC